MSKVKKKEIRPGVVLFQEGGKYKWARRYPHCLECGQVSAPHKAKGRCSKCYDIIRGKSPLRRLSLKNAGKRWVERSKNLKKFKLKNSKRTRRYYLLNKEKILDRKKFVRSLQKNKGVEIAVGQIRVRCPWVEIPLNYANEFLNWRKKLLMYAKYIKKT